MKAIAVVAHTGRGKTTFVKKLLKEMSSYSPLINDVNNEYEGIKGAVIERPEKFIEIAHGKTKRIIVFEEAAFYFRNRGGLSSEVMEMLIRKRHQNNVIIFVFHSLRQIPVEVVEFLDYMCLFYTNDRPDIVEKKFGEFTSIIGNYRKIKGKQLNRGHIKRGHPLYHYYEFFRIVA